MPLYLSDKIKCALWNQELVGQLSDGRWENRRGLDHLWKLRAEVGDPSQNHYSGCPPLADSQLLDAVGTRMLWLARAAKIVSEQEAEKLASRIDLRGNISNAKQYLAKYGDDIDPEDLEKIFSTSNTASYGSGNLKRDLYAIGLELKGEVRNRAEVPPGAQPPPQTRLRMRERTNDQNRVESHLTATQSKNVTSPEAKDTIRIKDIITKSGGSMFKQKELSQRMAASITSKAKALRRAAAAEQLGHQHIADIFNSRAQNLNESLSLFEQFVYDYVDAI